MISVRNITFVAIGKLTAGMAHFRKKCSKFFKTRLPFILHLLNNRHCNGIADCRNGTDEKNCGKYIQHLVQSSFCEDANVTSRWLCSALENALRRIPLISHAPGTMAIQFLKHELHFVVSIFITFSSTIQNCFKLLLIKYNFDNNYKVQFCHDIGLWEDILLARVGYVLLYSIFVDFIPGVREVKPAIYWLILTIIGFFVFAFSSIRINRW